MKGSRYISYIYVLVHMLLSFLLDILKKSEISLGFLILKCEIYFTSNTNFNISASFSSDKICICADVLQDPIIWTTGCVWRILVTDPSEACRHAGRLVVQRRSGGGAKDRDPATGINT